MIAVEILFLTVFWTAVATAVLFIRNTLLPRLPLSTTPEQIGLPAHTVRFPATDGMRLEAWEIPGLSEAPWVLLCHGLGANRADLLSVATGLHRAGFNLLALDFRAHGGSAGRVTSFGWLEQRDLEGALAYLGARPDVPARPYGVYGVSMGGAVALAVAARDERLGAVAADSPYANLEDAIKHHLALLYPWLPLQPFGWLALLAYRARFGAWPRQMAPEASAAALSPRALLLIHNAHDPMTPLAGTRRILASAGQPKELWVIEGDESAHLSGLAVDPASCFDRLSRFFAIHLIASQ